MKHDRGREVNAAAGEKTASLRFHPITTERAEELVGIIVCHTQHEARVRALIELVGAIADPGGDQDRYDAGMAAAIEAFGFTLCFDDAFCDYVVRELQCASAG